METEVEKLDKEIKFLQSLLEEIVRLDGQIKLRDRVIELHKLKDNLFKD